ncbi:hypothetical protein BD289DRAFT_372686 [Coniella lustricola]|uniref:Uncharacterized protein n=1 Tax=Coniella lustricola TaxID=2025994 RepID=A0A2T3A1Y9_9PEZI|nr:hypothetical protein BD289DRAFT_372686 [Coniella lustricola]
MPPQIPRASLRALSAGPATTSRIRPFSSTAAVLSDIAIPPESPRFIPLPEQPQSDEIRKPPVKGYLPVPREIFTKRAHKDHKLSPTFVRDTAPHSKAERRGDAPKSDKDAWKRLMAESRRSALGTGINKLWRRKTRSDGRAKEKADKHGERNLADKRAAERLDDVYTRGTVPMSTLNTKVIRDPEYETRKLESIQRTAALQQAKSEARKDALQRLYVEASKFIVTEEELAKTVDTLFTEHYFRKRGAGRGIFWGSENVWEAYAPPPTVRQMFADMRGTSQESIKSVNKTSRMALVRQKLVAGELAGGALSVELVEPKEQEQD